MSKSNERPNLLVFCTDQQRAFDLLQMRALVTNEYKLVYYAPAGEIMLFDRNNDPDEMVNLAGDPGHQPVVTELLKRLLHELSRTEPRRPRQICGA